MQKNSERKWNLDDILKKDNFEAEVVEIKREMTEWEKKWTMVQPKMSESDFKDFMDFDENLGDRISRLMYLPHLIEATNQKDSEAKLFKTKSNDLAIEYSNLTRKLSHWIKGKAVESKSRLDEGESKRLFESIPDLTYKLERMRLSKKHTLGEKEEEIIMNKDINGIEVVKDLRTLIETEFEYKLVINGKRKNIKTQAELMDLVHNKKPEVREAAYKSLLEKHKENIDKSFMIYQAVVKNWGFEKKTRKFVSPINMRNFSNDISDKTIDVLLETCQENKGVFQSYFKYKAKKLGKKKLSRFDIYAPMVDKIKNKISYEEAEKKVLEAFKQFSPGLANRAKTIMEKNHVDSHPNPNKISGAFCATVSPKIEPYVLLNFMGSTRDIFTMAHELGHGAHSLYAKDHYPSSQHSNLPLAETASTLAEMLLMDKLLSQENSKEKRKEIIAQKMDDSYATILRQNYFVIFEKRAHEAINKGTTEEDLSKIWLETLVEQFGTEVEIDPIFRYEWAYVSHIFESPFYCYAYNFGELLTMSLYKRYKEEGNSFVKKIEKLLAYGGSISPDKALKEIGVNTEDKNFWQGGFEILKTWQSELEKE